jgi:hypothetical protein
VAKELNDAKRSRSVEGVEEGSRTEEGVQGVSSIVDGSRRGGRTESRRSIWSRRGQRREEAREGVQDFVRHLRNRLSW